MRRYQILLVLFSSFSCVLAQGDPYIISRQGSVVIQPLYQSWSMKDGVKFSEFGTTLSLYVPISRSMNVSLRGGQASSGGDVPKLSGITDMQVGFGYHWESINTIVSCGVNLPSGHKELTQEEFETSVLFSNSIFNLQQPSFGQGFSLNPGIAWVYSVNDGVVLGLAGSFQYKGKYRPRSGMDDYDPGDELLLTGGVDLRLSESSSLSSDVVYTTYGADKIGGEKVFASGNAVSANVQYKQYVKENELGVFLRYRTKAKGEIASASGLVPEPERIEPSRFEFLTHYKINFSSRFSARVLGEARFYEKTAAAFSGANIFGIGVVPVLSLPSGLSFPARVKFQIGTQKDAKNITGVEIGAGIGFTF